jgi:lipopolysaccharide transport system ATP-binding protein
MSDMAIEVSGLGKRYKLGATRERYKSLRDSVTEMAVTPFRKAAKIFRGGRSGSESGEGIFWALRDLSFEVHRGEVLGVIGRNGAGKSTLLKVLSRITEPTTGRAKIFGRVGSLLEVGSGFHPELTGRENIFMNGAILGMSKVEIDRKLDEIIAFAEVDQFVDTPVKRYSSGMYMRLAFSVAAHLEPEILIIDEVLAVGDAAFQKKCLGKMGNVAKEGRTILFVSHNMTALQALCTRAIWLSAGELQCDGPATTVVTRYLQTNSETMLDRTWEDSDLTAGNEAVRLHRARVIAGDPFHITVATPLQVEFTWSNFIPNTRLNLSLHVYTLEGTCVFNSVSPAEVMPVGRMRASCDIPAHFLNDGYYRTHIMIVKDTSTVLFNHNETMLFEVFDTPREYSWYGKWPGVVRPNLTWDLEIFQDDEKILSGESVNFPANGRR